MLRGLGLGRAAHSARSASAGVRVLYTGDFSREEDRHLCGAETPAETPHVLICEATYGVALHMKRELREQAVQGGRPCRGVGGRGVGRPWRPPP